MVVWYGTFRNYVLRTSHLEPYRTSVPYFKSIFEAYRTNVSYPYHYKKAWRTSTITKKAYRGISVQYFLAKIEAYRIVLPSLLTTPSQNIFFGSVGSGKCKKEKHVILNKLAITMTNCLNTNNF